MIIYDYNCEVCGKKMRGDNTFDIGRTVFWVEEEGCWMCERCYTMYEGQTIKELRSEIRVDMREL
jgi:hypothetical protein